MVLSLYRPNLSIFYTVFVHLVSPTPKERSQKEFRKFAMDLKVLSSSYKLI